MQEKPAETKKAKKDENGAGDDEEDVEGKIFGFWDKQLSIVTNFFFVILDEGEEIEDEEYDLPYGEEEIDGEDEEEGKLT